MQGKAANCHMLFRMIRKIKVSSDWLGCVLVISFHIAKVFSESVTQTGRRLGTSSFILIGGLYVLLEKQLFQGNLAVIKALVGDRLKETFSIRTLFSQEVSK